MVIRRRSPSPQRIGLVNAFFGPPPFWMPAFIHSCRWNPTVDWLLFTNMPRPDDCPDNVHVFPMDLDEFNRRAAATLDMDIRVDPSFPYKICDLKPTFGEVFRDELADFDFWGHCDIDLVWGDVRRFLTDRMLDRHDIVSGRPRKAAGHFMIFRNDSPATSVFRGIPAVKRLLEDSSKLYVVDERLMTRHLRSRAARRRFRLGWQPDGAPPEDPLRIYWRRHLTPDGPRQFAALAGGGTYRWERGRAFDERGRERMYLHFHRFKKTMTDIDFDHRDRPDRFVVTAEGISADDGGRQT